MFRVTNRPAFTRTVSVRTPEGDGLRTETFRATFRWLPSAEIESFDTDSAEGIKDLLRAVIIRCDELVDDDNEMLPWDDALREAVLGWSHVRFALLLAYNSAWTEEKRGN